MYDQLTGRYTFACPARREVRVSLSRFRILELLPGTASPTVFKVTFACDCGGEHESLVTHEELDWAPLAGSDAAFLNLMTARLEPAAADLLDFAARRIQAGAWPWSFFCYPEDRPRPVTPSAFRVLSGGEEGLGLAVECPGCCHTSVNVVSPEHVDVPFYNDSSVGVVEHVFTRDRERALAAFRDELDSHAFDASRRALAA